MSEYQRGLKDAERICLDMAMQNIPFRTIAPRIGGQTFVNIAKKARAQTAIRCARNIRTLMDKEDQ